MNIHQFKSSFARGWRKDPDAALQRVPLKDYRALIAILTGGVAVIIWAGVIGWFGLRLVLWLFGP